MSDDIVWVTDHPPSRPPMTYHTDRNCVNLADATSTDSATKDELADGCTLCKTCSGEQEHYSGHNSKYYQAARQADPERLDG